MVTNQQASWIDESSVVNGRGHEPDRPHYQIDHADAVRLGFGINRPEIKSYQKKYLRVTLFSDVWQLRA